MRTASSSFSTEQVDDLAAIIERTNPEVAVSRGKLKRALLVLLDATGIHGETEFSADFQEFAGSEPTHASLAKRFRAIAGSDDPLNPELCSGIVLAELNAVARKRWAHRIKRGLINRPALLRGVSTDMLADKEIADVREMARQLAVYHQSFVRRGQPNKSIQDTLLEGIADIYIEFAELACGRYELPHAENSRFIQFTRAALRPFFPRTEVTEKAISRRWKRLKNANNEAAT